MPLYDFLCGGGHVFERYVFLADFEEAQFCTCGREAHRKPCAPFVRGDIPAYQSPKTGEWITSRAQRREDLRKHGCVEWDSGIADEGMRRRTQEDATLDAHIEETFERELWALPAQKRDRLAAEMESGMDVEITRSAPNVGRS